MIETANKQVEVDNEGYLIEPSDWNMAFAEELANQEDLDLSQEHWKIINFVRNYYNEHLTAPDSRSVVHYLSNELGYGRKANKQLFTLFPYGYVKQTCKIAGMKRPRAWSTG